MTVPDPVLTLAFWVHMLATVVWVGALASLSLFVIPTAKRLLPAGDFAQLMEHVQRRLDPVAWFSLALLVASGLVQMSANPNYEGLLSIRNRWALAILLKHIVFAGMVAVSAVLTWRVLPNLRRLALRQSRGLDSPDSERVQRQESGLLRLNLVLSLIVLVFTALARTS